MIFNIWVCVTDSPWWEHGTMLIIIVSCISTLGYFIWPLESSGRARDGAMELPLPLFHSAPVRVIYWDRTWSHDSARRYYAVQNINLYIQTITQCSGAILLQCSISHLSHICFIDKFILYRKWTVACSIDIIDRCRYIDTISFPDKNEQT